MASINKNTWLIVLLVVLNLVSLGALWISRTPPPPATPKGEHFSKVDKFFHRELNLDEEQMVEVKKLTRAHFQERKEIYQQIREQKGLLIKELSGETEDTVAINTILTEIARLESINERLFIDHYKNLKEVCTPEQLENLNKVFQRGIRPHGLRNRQHR